MKNGTATLLRIRLFYHSILSDWNNGHAHFLRGFVCELIARGHDVLVYEREDAWSVENLIRERGAEPLEQFAIRFPGILVRRYRELNLRQELRDCDLVIVHEWNPPQLIAELGDVRADGANFQLLFHDTHHRAVSDPEAMRRYDLRNYDGVLAFGEILRRIYLDNGWIKRAWTWHEAADPRVFHPMPSGSRDLDLVWIGNWGDDERSSELMEFLVDPVHRLGLRAMVFGVRYPDDALRALKRAGIAYGGWLPNVDVPGIFARSLMTVHVPRRPYARMLPGIPTIRPFEAMACGLPLICGPWDDLEHLFAPGKDYLVAQNGKEMKENMRLILGDRSLAATLSENGFRAIVQGHTCAHRVDQLLKIFQELGAQSLAACP